MKAAINLLLVFILLLAITSLILLNCNMITDGKIVDIKLKTKPVKGIIIEKQYKEAYNETRSKYNFKTETYQYYSVLVPEKYIFIIRYHDEFSDKYYTSKIVIDSYIYYQLNMKEYYNFEGSFLKKYTVRIKKEVNGKFGERDFTFKYDNIKHLQIGDYIYIGEMRND